MSQDIIRTSRPLTGDVGDVWGSGSSNSSGTALAPAGGGGLTGATPQPQPLQKLHRVLRGRYLLAVSLGLAGATVGGVAGWLSQELTYKATGVIEIKPIIFDSGGKDSTIPFYTQYMKSQALLMQSPPVIEEALKREEWRTANGPSLDPGYVQGQLKADYVNNSNNLIFTFEDRNPDLASAFVRSLIGAYEVRRGDTSKGDVAAEINRAEDRLLEQQRNISELKTQIRGIAARHGTTDLGQIHNPLLSDLTSVARQLDDVSFNREQSEQALRRREEQESQITAEQLAGEDPFLRTMISSIQQLQFEIDRARRNYGDNHPYVRRMVEEQELTQGRIDTRVEEVRAQKIAVLQGLDGQGKIVTPDTIALLKAQEDRLRERLAGVRRSAEAVGADQIKLREFQDVIDRVENDAAATERTLESRKAEALTSGGIYNVIDRGGFARVSSDDRRKVALLGTAAGGAIPFGLVLLWGLLDSRFRFSDEATGDTIGGPTLLGILPNLPDRLSDPNQASIAAHCVHQIRTMLQLNGLSDGPSAFAVTSATSGDGKTSLSLALGLSFAASGSRTLLIDTDLVGAGLSTRLEVHDDTGVVEALTGGDLMAHVRETDVADLAILPVGSAGAHHAGNFSPAAMRRLIGEAKKHFEVILIDTGPLLGSIEATPTAASVDGVILTVARGQSKPMVDKALTHLQHIGARLAGVVFNRAQARDFEQSINGMSMQSTARSVAAGHGANGSNGSNGHHARNGHGDATHALGPVAQAVAEGRKN